MKGVTALCCLFMAVMGSVGQDEGKQKKESRLDGTRARATDALRRKDYARAHAELDGLLEVAPRDVPARVQRAALRVLTGDARGASSDFNALIEIDEEKGVKLRFTVADRALWIARKHIIDGEHKEAIEILDVILHLFPDSGMAYHDRGAARFEIEDFKGAIDDFTKAIYHDDGNSWAGDSYQLRARARRAIGDESGADEDEKRAREKFDEPLEVGEGKVPLRE